MERILVDIPPTNAVFARLPNSAISPQTRLLAAAIGAAVASSTVDTTDPYIAFPSHHDEYQQHLDEQKLRYTPVAVDI